MGTSPSIEQNLWQSTFEFDSKNSRLGIIKLTDRQTEDVFICRKISTVDKKQIEQIDRLIDVKLSIQSPYLTKLERAQTQNNRQYCAYGKNYFLLFKQPYQTLKQETLNRKFKNSIYSEQELQLMLEVGIKALLFLKNIHHPHGNISSNSFFINENRSIVLGDPFIFPKQNSPQITKNGFVYPSPELIKYQNQQIESYNQHQSDLFTFGLVLLQVFLMSNMDCVYERYFQRVNHQAIRSKLNLIKSQQLRRKLFIILDPQPKNRQMIYKFYLKSISSADLYKHISKQQFKKNVQRYNLATSDVTEWKNDFPLQQRISSSQGKKTISVSTAQPINNNQDKAYNYYEKQYVMNKRPNVYFNSQVNYTNTKQTSQSMKQQESHQNRHIQNPQQYQFDRKDMSNMNQNFNNIQYGNHTELNNGGSGQLPKINWNLNQNPSRNFKYEFSALQNNLSTFNPTSLPSSSSFPQIKNLQQKRPSNYTNYNQPFRIKPYIQEKKQFGNNSDIKNNFFNINSFQNLSVSPQNYYPNYLIHNQTIENESKKLHHNRILYEPTYLENSTLNYSQKIQQNKHQSIKVQSQSPKIQKISLQNKIQSSTPSKRRKRISDYGKLHHLSTINQKSQFTDSYVSESDDHTSQILIQEDNDAPWNQNERYFELKTKVQNEVNQNKMWSILYPSGTRYVGQMKNDRRDGLGTFYYIDGSKYHGHWLDNKMNGFGTLYYPNGKIAYEGEWKLDNFHGKGKVFNDELATFKGKYQFQNCHNIDECWLQYEGELVEDRRQGRGILRLTNGEYFDGRFKEDKLHGLCKFYTLDGQVIEGIWQNNQLIKRVSPS